jgi:glycosyltransferase involved in cell wall biosynthesis
MPKFSIVTATIVRSTLERLCQSLDSQLCQDYEHIVVVDIPFKELTAAQKLRLENIVRGGDNRVVSFCQKRHQNYGNTCRHNVSPKLKGEYVLIMDDDDYFADNEVLNTLKDVKADWAVFPIMRYGSPYLFLPPASCRTGNAMFVYKSKLALYPDVNIYESDGVLVEELKTKAAYEVLKCRPLTVMELSHHGQDFQ